jgi:hypothetical protein
MNVGSPSKAQKIVNYLDIIGQTLLIIFVIILLLSPPQVEVGKDLNNPPISNMSDLIKEIMARGSLNFFSVMMSLTLSVILMVLPLFLLWTYQIITAVVLSLIFRNLFNLLYGFVFLAIILLISTVGISDKTFQSLNNLILFVFFVFPFLFYGKRIYDVFMAK